LKPPNVLFNRDKTQIKLCDFGVSNKIEKTTITASARAGSLRFMSPEQLDENLTHKIDVWALGCIMLQMVTGKVPYFGLNQLQIVSEVSKQSPLKFATNTYP
jgi:eukaryotic-like serine/threonine-protein kinase